MRSISSIAKLALFGSALFVAACSGGASADDDSSDAIRAKEGDKSWFVGNRVNNFATGDILRLQMDVPEKGQVRVVFAGAGCGDDCDLSDLLHKKDAVDVVDGTYSLSPETKDHDTIKGSFTLTLKDTPRHSSKTKYDYYQTSNGQMVLTREDGDVLPALFHEKESLAYPSIDVGYQMDDLSRFQYSYTPWTVSGGKVNAWIQWGGIVTIDFKYDSGSKSKGRFVRVVSRCQHDSNGKAVRSDDLHWGGCKASEMKKSLVDVEEGRFEQDKDTDQVTFSVDGKKSTWFYTAFDNGRFRLVDQTGSSRQILVSDNGTRHLEGTPEP